MFKAVASLLISAREIEGLGALYPNVKCLTLPVRRSRDNKDEVALYQTIGHGFPKGGGRSGKTRTCVDLRKQRLHRISLRTTTPFCIPLPLPPIRMHPTGGAMSFWAWYSFWHATFSPTPCHFYAFCAYPEDMIPRQPLLPSM